MPLTHQPLHLSKAARRYSALFGVGGIGIGEYFQLAGNHTLGREESRGGRFLDRRDYCKLHIIAHYIKVLLGPDFPVYLIGRVGTDDVGRRIMGEIRQTGFECRFLAESRRDQTLYSLCFLYPDGSGGNLTTDDSACSKVDLGTVDKAAGAMRRFAGRGVALAAPEVPLAARRRLLELATANRFLRCAAFTSGEIGEVLADGYIPMIDLLALNIHEAAMVAGLNAERYAPMTVIGKALRKLKTLNPRMMVSITAGRRGNWLCDTAQILFQPVVDVVPVSTAGAGDSHLGGLIVGLVAGLGPADALRLANLIASHKVTSPHTIDDRLDRASLTAFAKKHKVKVSPALADLLQ